MMSEELAFVALQGHRVPYSHAVLVETSSGWHVELEDVPSDSCPFVEGAVRDRLRHLGRSPLRGYRERQLQPQ